MISSGREPSSVANSDERAADSDHVMTSMRVGQGFDIHRFAEDDRPLVLAGVTFEGERGLLGHSDADAVAHAVSDALLGAAGLGDIEIGRAHV